MNTFKYNKWIVPAIGVACVLAAGSATAAPPVFSATVRNASTGATTLYLDVRAGCVALGDFNGDSKMDAAVAGSYVSGVAILLNNGAGGATQQWVTAGRRPVALTAGDFDADGDLDLAVALQGEAGVAILSNSGAGQFSRTAFHETGVTPQAVQAADMNNDGKLDLVVANRTSSTIRLLGNTGSGFVSVQTVTLPAVATPAPSAEPNHLAVADIVNNGWLDVVAACAGDDTVQLITNSNGLLSLAAVYDGGPYPVAVAAADLNNDAAADIVVANAEASQVTVLLSAGMGQYQAKAVPLMASPYAAQFASSVLLQDVDYDLDLEIHAAGAVFTNDGAGNFAKSGRASLGGVAGRIPGVTGTFFAAWTSSGVTLSYLVNLIDMNQDGYINVGDLLILAQAWNTQANDTKYDARADLNHDGRVNIFDLLILARHWNS